MHGPVQVQNHRLDQGSTQSPGKRPGVQSGLQCLATLVNAGETGKISSEPEIRWIPSLALRDIVRRSQLSGESL